MIEPGRGEGEVDGSQGSRGDQPPIFPFGPGGAEHQPSPEEMEAFAAAMAASEQAKAAGEAREDRMEDPENEKFLDEQAKEDLISSTKLLIPESELNDQEREARVSKLTDLYESEEVNIDQFAQELVGLGFRREAEGDTEPFLDGTLLRFFPNLTEEQRNAIKEKLPRITEQEKRDRANISDREADMMAATATHLGQKAEATGEKVNATIQAELDKLPPEGTGTPEQEAIRKELKNSQGRVNRLISRVTDFFGPETPGRNWARKIGKTLYFSLLALALVIILEMNLINKAAARKR